MDLSIYIAVDPKVMLGKPVIKGTRITVENILEKLANGYSNAEIIEAYPHLNDEKIKAALSYAAQSLKSDFIYPVASWIFGLMRA